MQNNTTKIITSIIAILAIGSIATFALSGSKPNDQMTKDTMTKSSSIMTKTDDTKMIMDKMKNEEAMMKKDVITKTSISNPTMKREMDIAMSKSSEIMSKPDSMTKEGDQMSKEMMNKSAEVSLPTGMYSQYSVTNLAQNSTGTNVIFFHAPWCPSCKSIDADITANLDKLPEGLQILKADFDTSTALKQKYGVTQQSTFIKVDKDGNKIGTASSQFGLKTVADIVAFGGK
jgi:thiol-disulfide isomerase/thioredoxin